MLKPTLQEEKKLWKKGYKRVVCLDEVGRGALCGPVVATAVMIKKFPISKGWRVGGVQSPNIKDSKKLSAKRRQELYKIFLKCPIIEWGIGKVSERIIDKINILEATKLAMEKAIKNLEKKMKKSFRQKSYDRRNFTKIDFLILDGKMKIDLEIPQKSIVKADEKVFSCAISSIIAKITRDRMMKKYHQRYPHYGFDKHKGYATKLHRKMLKKYGPCKIHRKSFKPVKNLIF